MVKWYDPEDVKKPKQEHKFKPAKLRGGITPGRVLILLGGKHSGKRVVFLKQLETGLLLVNGPYKLNGVPLKRLPQSFTLPTSTTIDLSGLDFSAITDQYFAKDKQPGVKSEEQFFAPQTKKRQLTDAQKTLQKDLDKKIMGNIKDNLLRNYLRTKFKLRNGVFPHTLRF